MTSMGSRVDFDNYTEDYEHLLGKSTRFFTSNETYFARYKVDIVRKRAAAQVKRLLEYGCGIGRNIPFLKSAFPDAEIVGSDISEASLDVARRNNRGVRFVSEDDLPEAIGEFDVILVANVFHHVPVTRRDHVAGVLRERLASDGRLFLFEHNPLNPLTCRIVRNCPYDADAVLIKPGELESILNKAGLAVECLSYCLFVPPGLSVLLPLERRLGWLPLGGQYWIEAGHRS